MRFVFLWILGIVFADTECPLTLNGDRRSSSQFRLVQYNIEWGFIDQYDNCPGNGCTWHNQSAAEKHLGVISDVICKLDGDLVNICEIEGCDELNILAKDTEYMPYLIKGTDTATGQNVGILTKIDPANLQRTNEKMAYPVPDSHCNYAGEGTTGVSKHYYTTMNISGIPVALIGCHLLAYPTDSARCASREAQAQILQNLIVSLTGHEIILMGDLNDFDNKVLDANDNSPTSMVLDILKGYEGKHRDEYELFSVAALMDKSARYTEWWDENSDCEFALTEVSMIDHILVTKALYDRITRVFIYHYEEYCGTYNSDHYPVVVDFAF